MSEIFERLCPRYMSYGMGYEEYWHGDPWSLKAYHEAYLLRSNQENTMMWLQGVYFTDAVNVALHNAFSKKGTPPKKYMEKPLDIVPKTEAEEAAEMAEKQEKLIAGLSAWKKMFDGKEKRA